MGALAEEKQLESKVPILPLQTSVLAQAPACERRQPTHTTANAAVDSMRAIHFTRMRAVHS